MQVVKESIDTKPRLQTFRQRKREKSKDISTVIHEEELKYKERQCAWAAVKEEET